jgi:hypothetical protein
VVEREHRLALATVIHPMIHFYDYPCWKSFVIREEVEDLRGPLAGGEVAAYPNLEAVVEVEH